MNNDIDNEARALLMKTFISMGQALFSLAFRLRDGRFEVDHFVDVLNEVENLAKRSVEAIQFRAGAMAIFERVAEQERERQALPLGLTKTNGPPNTKRM